MEELPDQNIFMMCRALRRDALATVPAPYRVRSCRPDELAVWKAMPFDDAATAAAYDGFMEAWFQTTYAARADEFFARTRFLCDQRDRPVATCMVWRAYDAIETIHWLKVVKAHEGKGLGRAVLSLVMQDLDETRYPVYLHTQPGSYRAIKLYSDFGFDLLAGDRFGSRTNDLAECLPILERHMPAEAFRSLRIATPPEDFVRFLETVTTIQF
ncbi:MAG TPA: GNAT family N-acetyltransferase [Kofleriaceae bacterium]|nr:GNAT family N-acetyltransferase [Kofleriaceae bacterium]